MAKAKRRRERTWEEPEELRRIREAFTEPRIRSEFQRLRGRPPLSETELEVWFEFYTLELYNGGADPPKFNDQNP
jgi:hypothetical protein